MPPSPYQQALFGLMERDVEGGVRGVNNAVMELRTICNHPLIRWVPGCRKGSTQGGAARAEE